MQYALLIYEDESQYRDENGRAWEAIIQAHQALAADLAEKGILRGGAGLKPPTPPPRCASRAASTVCTTGRSASPRSSWAAST